MTDSHFVYIMAHCAASDPDGPVKVGITKSLGSRLASVQTGSWKKLSIANYFDLGSRSMALEAERRFHETMAECRLHGEWFAMSPAEALCTLCDIVWTLIQANYEEGEDRTEALVNSGAIDALYEVTQGWPV